MAQHGGLGRRRGAAGVEQDGDVVAVGGRRLGARPALRSVAARHWSVLDHGARPSPRAATPRSSAITQRVVELPAAPRAGRRSGGSSAARTGRPAHAAANSATGKGVVPVQKATCRAPGYGGDAAPAGPVEQLLVGEAAIGRAEGDALTGDRRRPSPGTSSASWSRSNRSRVSSMAPAIGPAAVADRGHLDRARGTCAIAGRSARAAGGRPRG